MKKIALVLFGLLVCSSTYADQCPSVSQVVIDGKWHVPHGWNFENQYGQVGTQPAFTVIYNHQYEPKLICGYESPDTNSVFSINIHNVAIPTGPIAPDCFEYGVIGWCYLGTKTNLDCFPHAGDTSDCQWTLGKGT